MYVDFLFKIGVHMEAVKKDLSDTAKSLLLSCAQAMANSTEVNLNLFFISSELNNQELVLCYLAGQVEAFSSGSLTVRLADPQVVDRVTMGFAIYMVSCPSSTSEEVVTKVTDDMKLYSLGPYRNGFCLEDPKK